MSLALLFSVGYLLARHVGERVANGLLVSIVAVSVATAFAVAVSASGFELDPVLVDSVRQAMATARGLGAIGLLVIGFVALAFRALRRLARRGGS
jgi:cellobiose-specific phosphotransferase system component IIC